jgi:hypothetical protein
VLAWSRSALPAGHRHDPVIETAKPGIAMIFRAHLFQKYGVLFTFLFQTIKTHTLDVEASSASSRKIACIPTPSVTTVAAPDELN